MAFRRPILAAASLFLFLAVMAPAADTRPASLPGQVAGVLSFESPLAFLESTDAFLAAILSQTPHSYQEGMLMMLAPMFLPPPLLEADLEAETHILLLSGMDALDRLVFLLSVADYPAFLGEMSADGEPSEVREGVTRITADGAETFFADAGDGLALFAMREDDATDALAALRGWRPAARSDAAASLVYRQTGAFTDSGMMDAAMEMISTELAEKGDEMAREADNAGFDGSMAKGAFALIRKWVETLAEERANFAGGRIDLRIDRDAFALAFLLWPGEGGLFAGIAGKAAALENEIYPLSLAVGNEAGVFVQQSPHIALLPGGSEQLKAFHIETMREIWPDSGNAASSAFDAFIESGPGEIALAVLDNGATITYMRVDDPAKAMKAAIGNYSLLDSILKRFFKEDKIRLAVNSGTEGGVAFERAALEVDGDSKLYDLAERAGTSKAALDEALAKFSIMWAASDRALIAGTGGAIPEQLSRAVSGVAGAASPFAETPAAKDMLVRIGNRQIAVGMAKVSAISRMLVDSLASDGTMSEKGRRILVGVIPDLIVSDALAGFGLGVADGGFSFELAVSARGVNDLIRNYSLIAEREAMLYPNKREDYGEYDDIGEEGGDDDRDY